MKPKILLAANSRKEYYVDAVNAAGGIAYAEYCPDASLEYDGLVLCGGNDIDPKYYGDEIDGSVYIDEARDAAEIKLVRAFIEAKKPVLGICRGSQLINVAFGGSLYQDLSNAEEHKPYDRENYRVHKITAKENSVIYNLYGKTFSVNSAHHQAVKKLGDGLILTASADGVVEAFEHKSLPVFGVQFHPEMMCLSKKRSDTVDGIKVFEHFIDLIKSR